MPLCKRPLRWLPFQKWFHHSDRRGIPPILGFLKISRNLCFLNRDPEFTAASASCVLELLPFRNLGLLQIKRQRPRRKYCFSIETCRMAHRRASNLKRTEWNRKCREQLSAHICKISNPFGSVFADMFQDNRLGITIEPSQVRLKTNPEDSYTWERMEKKEHLFSKKISDLSTGVLKELCEGIDKSFAAIWKPSIRTLQAGNAQQSVSAVICRSLVMGLTDLLHKYLLKPEVSFTATINELQEDKARLASELSKWKDQAALESEMRRQAEEHVSQLKATLQEAQKDNRKLEQHVL